MQLDGLAKRVFGNKPRIAKRGPLSVAEALCSTGESLREIMPQHYIDAIIAIVCGKSPDGKGYLRGAYFDEQAAVEGLSRVDNLQQ